MENVLFLINHAGKAGTERYVQTLIEGAPAYGMRPFFAYNEPGPLLEKVRALGVPERRLQMRNPFDLAAVRGLARICEDFRIGIVHTNYLRENYIAILSKPIYKSRLRIVYTNHFVVPDRLPVRLTNAVMTRADHRIISVCEAGVHNLIRNGNARRKIMVIHNAVDPFIWKPGPGYSEIRAHTRGAYGIGADEKVFVCASRFAEDKGHGFLLEALALLKAGFGVEGMHVLLAGDGPLQPEIRARVDAAGLSGCVRFVGFVKDVKPLFYAADAYLNPSRHEASSFLILEALASGLPVIAADMGGNREIVNDRNGCGTLVKYGDAQSLCEVIQTYRTDGALLKEKSANAVSTIEHDFALPDMLAKTFAAFY